MGGRKGEEKREKKKVGNISIVPSRGGGFNVLTGDTSINADVSLCHVKIY